MCFFCLEKYFKKMSSERARMKTFSLRSCAFVEFNLVWSGLTVRAQRILTNIFSSFLVRNQKNQRQLRIFCVSCYFVFDGKGFPPTTWIATCKSMSLGRLTSRRQNFTSKSRRCCHDSKVPAVQFHTQTDVQQQTNRDPENKQLFHPAR